METKSITQLRNSLFESFDAVASGKTLQITHKNGSRVAMVSVDIIEQLREEVDLHKNLAIGYAQALRGEGVLSSELKLRLKDKERALRAKFSG